MNENCYNCENFDCDENGAYCMLLDSSKCSFLKADRATDTTVEVGDVDKYSVELQNGDGYLDSCGNYVSFGSNDAWWNQDY